MERKPSPPPSRFSAEIYPASRNRDESNADAEPMATSQSPLNEDAALKDAALALADAITLKEMARDHLRDVSRGLARSHLLTRLRRSQMTGRDAVQYLDGVQLEAAFARARVHRHPAKSRRQTPPSERARQKSAAIAARMLLFSPPADAAPATPPPVAKAPAAARLPTFVAIDFETATNRRDSACAIGAVLVEDGVVTAEFQTLIRPPWLHVDPRHQSIHGIGTRQLTQAPTFAEAFAQLKPLIESADVLVAHNAGFDRSVLEACCRTARLSPPTLPWLCTVQLSRRAFNLPSAKLPAVAAHLGVALHHHDAMSDAQACASIMTHIGRRHPKLLRDAVQSSRGVPRAHSAFAAVPSRVRS